MLQHHELEHGIPENRNISTFMKPIALIFSAFLNAAALCRAQIPAPTDAPKPLTPEKSAAAFAVPYVKSGVDIACWDTAAIAHLAHSTPTEFLFTPTDFNSYVTVSTADGAPQRNHGRMSASKAPGIGIAPKMDVLGEPVVVIG